MAKNREAGRRRLRGASEVSFVPSVGCHRWVVEVLVLEQAVRGSLAEVERAGWGALAEWVEAEAREVRTGCWALAQKGAR